MSGRAPKTADSHAGHAAWWRDAHVWIAAALGPIAWAFIVFWSGKAPAVGVPPVLVDTPWRFLAIVALYPIAEEFVFRGWLQPAIGHHLKHRALPGVSAANFVTSVLFAAAHLLNHPPALAWATFFPSLVFGHLRERQNRLAPCIAMHMFYNTGYVWLLG